jgi:hypothetical protein
MIFLQSVQAFFFEDFFLAIIDPMEHNIVKIFVPIFVVEDSVLESQYRHLDFNNPVFASSIARLA